MKKWDRLRIDKAILKNVTLFSFVLLAWSMTLFFYLLFLHVYGTDMKIYDVGILAGATGAVWGYVMTKIGDFHKRVRNMDKKEFYNPSFFKNLLTLNIFLIVVTIIVNSYLRNILSQY